MREIDFAPEALDALDAAARTPRLGERLDEALDWIEQSPPDIRAKRRSFSNGRFYIEVTYADEDWLIIWTENPADKDSPRVLCLGLSFL